MNKPMVVKKILGDRSATPQKPFGCAFAPSNVALTKYWGKRDTELNLPITASLSISLGDKGAATTIAINDNKRDEVFINGQAVASNSAFYARLSHYLNLFRPPQTFYKITTKVNIPIAAGLASSACGFASLIKALDDLYDWQLSVQQLSILARLGSGSACRSLLPGFVEWQAGSASDGLDSYAVPIDAPWPSLRIGLLIVDRNPKPLSSTAAMQQTVNTSALYTAWPDKVAADLLTIKQAITAQNFALFGQTAESNALAMHALMQTAWPPINYATPVTLASQKSIWKLREQGLPVYFTQDAGPNLKLLFLAEHEHELTNYFPQCQVISPF